MNTTIVRYKVQADKADENRAFIGKVFEEPPVATPADIVGMYGF